MTYYEFTILASSEKIKRKANINLNEYDYSNTIAAVNKYMYRTMKNGFTFFIYREAAEGLLSAAFSFDGEACSYQDAYRYILDKLNEAFGIRKIRDIPCEITAFYFYECLQEARRRELAGFTHKVLETANLLLFDCFYGPMENFGYELTETIVSEKEERSQALYDCGFQNELINIKSHKINAQFTGNMVHYVISSRSMETACDMAENLVQHLYAANRINSKRLEIVHNIEPDLYRKSNHLEDVIENNFGGSILIELTEKFGCDPADYTMTCQYLERLVKKYKNKCLFIFAYNMEHTGFSYFLLPCLTRYIIPVNLREGVGNRNSAVAYLEALIGRSDYVQYANQAEEFLQQFPGDTFTQTDVVQAYEQFETWCLNKNILNAYHCNATDDFMLDRDHQNKSGYDELQRMIGLHPVKRQIDDILATSIVEKERKQRLGIGYTTGSMHMIFAGNPGTAKTTVARLFAGIAKEKGVLKSGAFVERGGMDLDGLCCVSNIRSAFTAAKGGVLFIDEAYSLHSSTAIAVLLQEMENHREDVIVVLAGYSERMQEFLERNEGLKSRIPYYIDFPDYSASELTDIFKLMVKEKGLSITEEAVKEAYYHFEKARRQDNFGNGRYVRNLMENAIQNQSVRLLGIAAYPENIHTEELFSLTHEDISPNHESCEEERATGTAQRELDNLVGLSNVKAVIRKAKANFKLKKFCLDRGIRKDNTSLHMVFTGNPGTAKTTVARLFAEIMKDEKVLSTGKFVEVGRADLVGDHVGATAPLVRKRFREASGGVLFIDEAYSLCDGYENGFGDEAITTIVQEMENHRDNIIVIFAGYPAQMKHFLSRNPGLSSRIAFHVDFEDYTTDELCEITKQMLFDKQMEITNEAMAELRKYYEGAKDNTDYGNGRFVRKLLEEAEMNLAERILRLNETEITEDLITTIREDDIPKAKEKKAAEERITMGFCG